MDGMPPQHHPMDSSNVTAKCEVKDSVGKYFSLLPAAEKGGKENQSD